MTVGDIFWLFLRWLHVLAAASWIGSVLFYATVINPSFKSNNSTIKQPEHFDWAKKLEEVIVGEWREFLEITAFILVISGALIAFNRLSQPNIGSVYVIVLGVKVALTIIMPFIAFRKINNPKRVAAQSSSFKLVASLGVVVILLAIILRAIYDKSITS